MSSQEGSKISEDWSPIIGHLGSFTTDSACQLNILWHDGNSLCVDGTEIGVFKDSYQIGFTGFLESHDSRRLESKVGLEVLCDFADQSLEWKFSDEKLGKGFKLMLVRWRSRPIKLMLSNSQPIKSLSLKHQFKNRPQSTSDIF